MAQETERLEKLKASAAAAAALKASTNKSGGVGCNLVESQGAGAAKSAEIRSLENKKQRENNFQNQLKELQSKSDKQEKELHALRADQNKQHAEIMAVLLKNNPPQTLNPQSSMNPHSNTFNPQNTQNQYVGNQTDLGQPKQNNFNDPQCLFGVKLRRKRWQRLAFN